ncbi:DNA ligase, partial [uncultured Nitrospira sp.]|uniref:DNA ligase n=1 Tax=uncultured Nitrospira sp. TaxID=157176 RepID=UPI00314092AC
MSESGLRLQNRLFPVILLIILLPFALTQAGTIPELMLADIYREGLDLSQYRVSEKLDGVRARWDGTHLISRGGNVFAAPEWFINRFPPIPLDGELWMGRGRYEEVSSIVRTQQSHDGWRNVRLMVFDLPAHGGIFAQRVIEMNRLKTESDSPYLGIIEQQRVGSEEDLLKWLHTVIDEGGEGLMLHRETALYASGRSQDLLKLKLFTDAEATVIGYRPGKGQFDGLIGSLKVRTDDGVIFFIGSGLSHEERRRRPPLESRVTFRHQGLTENGIPRFPVFLRIRDEEP